MSVGQSVYILADDHTLASVIMCWIFVEGLAAASAIAVVDSAKPHGQYLNVLRCHTTWFTTVIIIDVQYYDAIQHVLRQ